MSNSEAKKILEAALLCALEPLATVQLEKLYSEIKERDLQKNQDAASVAFILTELQADWADKGIELVQIASGWRFQLRATMQPHLEKLSTERPVKYSRATLETLAVIAYRQPVTRGDIEQIRGVSVNTNIIRSLEERGWIEEVGVRDVPGRPGLLATTSRFLDDLGLSALSQLPSLPAIQATELTASTLEALPTDWESNPSLGGALKTMA